MFLADKNKVNCIHLSNILLDVAISNTMRKIM
jgi:hypothetical protein